MGIQQLWANLRQAGVVQELSSADKEDRQIVEALDGTAMAVDASIWFVQATLQPNLAEHFHSPTARALKVCFDRCVQWLRFGCVPVAVLEGRSPQEKQAVLAKRFEGRFNASISRGHVNLTGERGLAFKAMNKAIAALWEALGLPAVQAPGEAEAMCATLQLAGLVQACATRDSDALVMGATKVFHTITLAVGSKTNSLAFCDLETVRGWLHLKSGGSEALLLLALLAGGDYHQGGERIGMKTAIASLRHLLKGHQNDTGLLERMEMELEESDPSALALIPKQCSGCKRCGHEGDRRGSIKQHSKRNICRCCPPPLPTEAAAGLFCQLQEPGLACQCQFHTSKDKREFFKMVDRLRATPNFFRDAKRAHQAYEQQMQEAAAAVRRLLLETHAMPGVQLQWMRRPDPVKVHEALQASGQGLPWDLRTVERKLHLLLREWDAAHPDSDAEYAVKRIVKTVGSRSLEDAEASWAYMVDWQKGGKLDDEVSDVEFDEGGRLLRRRNDGTLVEARVQSQSPESGDDEGAAGLMSQGSCHPQADGGRSAAEVARARKRANAQSGGRRYVRKSLLRRHWPRLVAEFEARVLGQKKAAAQKLAKKAQKEAQQRAKEGFQPNHRQTTIDMFMRQAKPKQALPASLPRIQAAGFKETPAASRAPPSSQGAAVLHAATPCKDVPSAAVNVREEVIVLGSPEQPGNALAAQDEPALHEGRTASAAASAPRTRVSTNAAAAAETLAGAASNRFLVSGAQPGRQAGVQFKPAGAGNGLGHARSAPGSPADLSIGGRATAAAADADQVASGSTQTSPPATPAGPMPGWRQSEGMPGCSRSTHQRKASPGASIGRCPLTALDSQAVAGGRVPGLSSAAAQRGCSPPVCRAGDDQRDAGPDATSADSALPGPTVAAVQPGQRNDVAAGNAAPQAAGPEIILPAAAVGDGPLGQDAAAAKPKIAQPSASAWEHCPPEPDIACNYEHKDRPGGWGDDYSDQWGYGGISPGPSFTPEPEAGGQLGATAETAPAAACPRHSQHLLRPEFLYRACEAQVEARQNAGPPGRGTPGQEAGCRAPSSPDKRERSLSPGVRPPESQSPRPGHVPEWTASPAKKQRTPAKAAGVTAAAGRTLPMRDKYVQRSAAIQPGTPAPLTGDSSIPVLSQDTDAAAAVASRRLDFDGSRGFEADAQTQTRQPQPEQHQVDLSWALHHVPIGGRKSGAQGVPTPVVVPRRTRVSTPAVKLEQKVQQPVQGVEVVDLVTPPARSAGAVVDETVDLTADSPQDVILI